MIGWITRLLRRPAPAPLEHAERVAAMAAREQASRAKARRAVAEARRIEAERQGAPRKVRVQADRSEP